MIKRTTIILDDRAQRAANALARRYRCSTSEAIRRALVQQLEAETRASPAERARRREVLTRLFKLFEGSDPEAEVRRLKSEDAGF